jgi:ABC-2 type transport system permease protein
MTLLRHELRQGRLAFLIWTVSIGFLLAVCIFLFPEMKGQMEDVSDMFSNMGAFSTAFGMDQLNFGTLIGFYCVECGNILGIGGAFYASLCAVSMLSKEEKNRTAEFLLAHPVSRVRILSEKLSALLLQITAMNLILYVLSIVSITVIGETIPWRDLNLIHFAYFFLQIELAGICFGLSSILHQSSTGIGLGIAAIMYFLNLIANITDSVALLKYITPFAYCEGSEIVANGSLNGAMLAIGFVFCMVGIGAAYLIYCRKDIQV